MMSVEKWKKNISPQKYQCVIDLIEALETYGNGLKTHMADVVMNKQNPQLGSIYLLVCDLLSRISDNVGISIEDKDKIMGIVEKIRSINDDLRQGVHRYKAFTDSTKFQDSDMDNIISINIQDKNIKPTAISKACKKLYVQYVESLDNVASHFLDDLYIVVDMRTSVEHVLKAIHRMKTLKKDVRLRLVVNEDYKSGYDYYANFNKCFFYYHVFLTSHYISDLPEASEFSLSLPTSVSKGDCELDLRRKLSARCLSEISTKEYIWILLIITVCLVITRLIAIGVDYWLKRVRLARRTERLAMFLSVFICIFALVVVLVLAIYYLDLPLLRYPSTYYITDKIMKIFYPFRYGKKSMLPVVFMRTEGEFLVIACPVLFIGGIIVLSFWVLYILMAWAIGKCEWQWAIEKLEHYCFKCHCSDIEYKIYIAWWLWTKSIRSQYIKSASERNEKKVAALIKLFNKEIESVERVMWRELNCELYKCKDSLLEEKPIMIEILLPFKGKKISVLIENITLKDIYLCHVEWHTDEYVV